MHRPIDSNGVALRDINYWWILTGIFAVFTAVMLLGEYVFHWWRDPGELFGAAGLVMTVLGWGFAASRGQAGLLLAKQDQMLAKQDLMLAKMDEMLAMQRRLLELAERQTRLLEELVHSFRSAQLGGAQGVGAPP